MQLSVVRCWMYLCYQRVFIPVPLGSSWCGHVQLPWFRERRLVSCLGKSCDSVGIYMFLQLQVQQLSRCPKQMTRIVAMVFVRQWTDGQQQEQLLSGPHDQQLVESAWSWLRIVLVLGICLPSVWAFVVWGLHTWVVVDGDVSFMYTVHMLWELSLLMPQVSSIGGTH